MRGGDVLERIGQVRTLFLDKTGTLTAGTPTLVAAAVAGWLHPPLAAVAMVLSSITLLANSARLHTFPGPAAAPSPLRDR